MVMSRNNRRAAGSVLPHDPAPGRQCHCNGTHDTMLPTSTEERCFLLGLLRGYIAQPTELSSVSGVEWVGWWVVRHLPASKDVNMEAEKLQHWKPLPGNNRWIWEDLVHAVVNCWVCQLAAVLQLLVVMFCKCSINLITNPTPSIVTHTRDNIITTLPSLSGAVQCCSYVTATKTIVNQWPEWLIFHSAIF
jgi:hypothetical protein